MKILVISKPVYSYIMPLFEFPNDGDIFNIELSVETLTNLGSVIACTLGKYGLDVSFTGIIGEDEYKNKIYKIFDSYKVEHKYLEINYNDKTSRAFEIYNQKTNKFTKINELNLKSNLTKYKYEFVPDILIMDDKDYQANLAALNNYPEIKSIFIGEKYSKDSNIYCNKCNYVISSLSFASSATGIFNNLNKQKTLIDIFQKYIDLYSSNLIIKLDNFDVLYCINDEVRLIKNQNNNLCNKDYVFYSVLSYFLINNDIETAIKNTNKLMINSKNNLNILENIPDYSFVNQINTESNTITGIINSNNQNVNVNNSDNLIQNNENVKIEKTIENNNNQIQNSNNTANDVKGINNGSNN